MFCSRCGQPLSPEGKFCASCGQAVPVAQQPFPPPVAQVAPAALTDQLARVLTWNWKGPLKVAGATLGVSLVLTLIFGLATKPYGPNVHWSFKSLYTWLVWGWESIFGVSAVAGADANGSYSVLSGSGSAHASLGAMPLTLTVITLLVAAIVFRRVIRNCASALSAVLLGLRAALMIAIPLWFLSLFASLSVFDLAKLAGVSTEGSTPCDGLCNGFTNLTNARAQGVDWSASLTASSLQAFFVVLLLMVGLFAALTLSRAEWFQGRILRTVRLLLVAPVRAFGFMSIALVVAGLIFAFVTVIVRWNSHAGLMGGYSPSLSTHNWVILIFAFIAYAGNFGVAVLGLGSWGDGTATATATWSGSLPNDLQPGSITCTIQHGISWWAQGNTTISTNPCSGFQNGSSSFGATVPSLDWGVWTAAILAPLVLLYIAWSIVKANGHDPKSKLISLSTWVVSLLAVLPVLAYLAKVSVGGSADGHASVMGNGYSFSGDGSASLGLSGATPFIIFGYALVFALLVALFSGAINANTFNGLNAAVANAKAAQQPATQLPPPLYQQPAYQPPTEGQQPPPHNTEN